MRDNRAKRPFYFLLALLGTAIASAAPTLSVPADIDHSGWHALLQTYVDERGLVNYKAWHDNKEDLHRLSGYVDQFAKETANLALGKAELAALVNACNAFTIRWILENFPVESIRKTDDPFGASRWRIGGRAVSLDEIEHENLRPLYGWKMHGVLVCAQSDLGKNYKHNLWNRLF